MSNVSAITLADKYAVGGERALMTGRQALVRLPLLQRESDRQAGLNTAGLISGYRGSPLGSYDTELASIAATLKSNDIVFQPAVNEDLALTALSGSQQLDFIPGRQVDGVFGLWYGKGPGVDRSGDAIKHANLLGVSPAGGIVLAFGDDHAGKSSTTAHQSDLTLASWEVPILYPSSVSEIVDLGLAAFAMSRFSGLLVGLKLVNETAEATSVVALHAPPSFIKPDHFERGDSVHIRREVRAMQIQDTRLIRQKLPRAQAFARANNLDRITFGCQAPRFLIATAGKAYADTLAALELLGLTQEVAEALEVGVYKIALIYPLDPVGLNLAAQKADEILFIEEKRPHAENQAKSLMFNMTNRPRLSGKTDPDGAELLPADIPLNRDIVAVALAERLCASMPNLSAEIPGFVAAGNHAGVRQTTTPPSASAARRPAFCPGCPHNLSTQVPNGSFGATGIGCHGMVLFQPERNPIPMGQMGGEGAHWIGLSPFTAMKHIFQNLGDGTYNHSGSLAIRAAAQAGVNITFKILFNDAVAMTGGQPVEGGLTVRRIVEQVRAEGVGKVIVVSEQPDRFAHTEQLPAGIEVRHRDDLNAVQEVLRLEPGVTAIVYDQTCAAEKRRRRKTGDYPDPDRRIFINAAVCEGCGDCSAQSNCVAIQPLETELGRKRQIDQSACNKDFSCTKGFCPSFVTVEGARPRERASASGATPSMLAMPIVPELGSGFDMVVAGVGGTGVVTVSAILGMAARIEGYGANLYDMTGLSQKGGQVFSHLRLRPDPAQIVSARVGPGEADLLLACDLVAATQNEAMDTIASGKTMIIGNTDVLATADFQSRRDLTVPLDTLVLRLSQAAGQAPSLLAAASTARAHFGDSIMANVVMLGYAWQSGVIPLSMAALEQAITLNGKAARANLEAFHFGRAATLKVSESKAKASTLDEFIALRKAELCAYWNRAYAARYVDLMDKVRAGVENLAGGPDFAWAVARSAYKLMAYKDEYEIARLYSDRRFRDALKAEFGQVRRIKLYLAPPLFAKMDAHTGRPRKIAFGGWILPIFRVLAAMRLLREGPLDLFGRSEERQIERTLRDRYLHLMSEFAVRLSAETLVEAIELAKAPLDVRGFGSVKRPAAEALLARLTAASEPSSKLGTAMS
jgi:indolepyruvate ferredoxin oxidoreductase